MRVGHCCPVLYCVRLFCKAPYWGWFVMVSLGMQCESEHSDSQKVRYLGEREDSVYWHATPAHGQRTAPHDPRSTNSNSYPCFRDRTYIYRTLQPSRTPHWSGIASRCAVLAHEQLAGAATILYCIRFTQNVNRTQRKNYSTQPGALRASPPAHLCVILFVVCRYTRGRCSLLREERPTPHAPSINHRSLARLCHAIHQSMTSKPPAHRVCPHFRSPIPGICVV